MLSSATASAAFLVFGPGEVEIYVYQKYWHSSVCEEEDQLTWNRFCASDRPVRVAILLKYETLHENDQIIGLHIIITSKAKLFK